jgi:hypothetical protein
MPDGTPKKRTPIDLKSLARSHTGISIETLSGVAKSGTSEAARVSAAIALLDRGWGKPNQPTENKIEGKVEIVLRDLAAELSAKKKNK